MECRVMGGIAIIATEMVKGLHVPTAKGDLWIDAEHMPLIQVISPGIVRLSTQSNLEISILVGGGLLKLEGGKVEILASEASLLAATTETSP